MGVRGPLPLPPRPRPRSPCGASDAAAAAEAAAAATCSIPLAAAAFLLGTAGTLALFHAESTSWARQLADADALLPFFVGLTFAVHAVAARHLPVAMRRWLPPFIATAAFLGAAGRRLLGAITGVGTLAPGRRQSGRPDNLCASTGYVPPPAHGRRRLGGDDVQIDVDRGWVVRVG